jgi:DNA-directed RNA polymerase specialized sigma24 family protein
MDKLIPSSQGRRGARTPRLCYKYPKLALREVEEFAHDAMANVWMRANKRRDLRQRLLAEQGFCQAYFWRTFRNLVVTALRRRKRVVSEAETNFLFDV